MTAPTPTPLINFAESDLDKFETRLDGFVRRANPAMLVRLANEATSFIENLCENSTSETFRFDGWTHLNNATSAINHVAVALKNRI